MFIQRCKTGKYSSEYKILFLYSDQEILVQENTEAKEQEEAESRIIQQHMKLNYIDALCPVHSSTLYLHKNKLCFGVVSLISSHTQILSEMREDLFSLALQSLTVFLLHCENQKREILPQLPIFSKIIWEDSVADLQVAGLLCLVVLCLGFFCLVVGVV